MTSLSSPAAVGAASARAIVGRRMDPRGAVFAALLLLALVLSMAFLLVLVWELLAEGRQVIFERLGSFLSRPVTTTSTAGAGIWQGIQGTLMLVAIVGVVAFPLGVGAGVWLEEYASPRSRIA